MHQRLKNFLKHAFLILFGLIAGLLLTEALFRLLPPRNLQPNRGIAIADERGYTIHQKNFDGPLPSGENAQPVHVKTNGMGFVGNDYPLSKPADAFRLAFLGDSFLEAFQVDFEKSFASLTEQRLLADQAPKKAEVLNFGVGGQGTVEEMLRYHYDVSGFRPDGTVVFFYPNDFDNNQYYLEKKSLFDSNDPAWTSIEQSNANFKQERKDFKYWVLKTFRLTQYLDLYVRQNPALYKLGLALGLYHQGVLGQPVEGIPPDFFVFQNPLPQSQKTVFDFTAELLAFFRDRAADQSSKFLIVYIPRAEQVDSKLWQGVQKDIPALGNYNWDMDQPNRLLADYAVGRGLEFVDLTPSFRDFYQKHAGEFLYNSRGSERHDGHLNEAGHLLVADILVNYFEKQWLSD